MSVWNQKPGSLFCICLSLVPGKRESKILPKKFERSSFQLPYKLCLLREKEVFSLYVMRQKIKVFV